MKKYIIERDLPGVGGMSAEELKTAACTSNGVLDTLGPGIQWVQSHLTADKLFCLYLADSEETILEHARLSGFPASRISEVVGVIDPVTAG